MFPSWPIEDSIRNTVQGLNDVGATSMYCKKDNTLSYIQQTIHFQEKKKPYRIVMEFIFCYVPVGSHVCIYEWLWKEMVQSRLNKHLNVSAMRWTVIPVLKLITKQLFCEDVLVLQRPSSFGHWENKMELQIINNIQRLIRSVLAISKTFRLEYEETEYLPTN